MTQALVAASGGIGAGPWGFLVVLALIVIAVFLFRSMTRHLRKVPKTFDDPVEPYEEAGATRPDTPRTRPPGSGQSSPDD